MENCLCRPPGTPATAPQPPSLPDASRRFDAVRRALFAEFARVTVAGGHPIQQLALSHPQALGNVIPEAWAIISEILAFYDVLITRDLFIGSATTRMALQQLSDLLGYLPRPSVAAETHVALVGSQTETLTSTLGLTLRASLPSPQVFEPDQIKTLSWIPRTATLAPVRNTIVSVKELDDDTIQILLEAATAAPQRNSPVLFLYGYQMRATEILGVKVSQELDGLDYIEVIVTNPKAFDSELKQPLLLGDDVEVRNVSILSPSQRAFVRTELLGDIAGAFYNDNDFALGDEASKIFEYKPGGYGPSLKNTSPVGTLGPGGTAVELDGVYRTIKVTDLVILQKGGYFSPHRVVKTLEKLQHIGDTGDDVADVGKPQIPITVITLNPPLNADLKDGTTSGKLIIHYNFHDIGRLMRPAQSELDPNELMARGKLELEGVHRTPGSKPYSGQWLLEDANGRGTLVNATMEIADPTRGKATLQITKSTGPATKLRTPIVAHPNILHVTRGETVKDELLGSGDPTIPSQRFELKKSPLTYVRAATERGMASTLEVRVDGVRWHEVRTFYGAGPNDQVYIVRQDEDERSTVIFGDGVRGARLRAGVRVRATYRFGAGAAAPPPASLTQIVRGIPGLASVRSPLGATGGDDRETERIIRKAAPASALVLGRCVSLSDFSAYVANFSGVLNSHVELAWDEAKLAAVVTVWYIPATPDDPHLAANIVGDLQKLSDPGTLVVAKQAKPVSLTLVIEIAVSSDYVAKDVAAAARAALLDPDTGLLAIVNTPLGSGGLSRSALAAAVMATPGVLDITDIYNLKLDNITKFPGPGLPISSGEYLDFFGNNAPNLFVEVTATTQRDCCDSGS